METTNGNHSNREMESNMTALTHTTQNIYMESKMQS